MGKQWKQWQTLFSWTPKSLQMVTAAMKLKDAYSLEEKLCWQRSIQSIKTMLFPVFMYGCDSWTIKKAEDWKIYACELWCWRRLLRVPWTSVNPKGNQSWIFIGRTDAKVETPILWSPDAKNWLIRKDPDAGKDWRQEEKGMTEDEMVGWHHRLEGHEFEQTLGVGDGQGGLVCCSPWGCKELDMTERLNWLTDKLF